MAIWKRENNKIPQNREMKLITWQITGNLIKEEMNYGLN